MEERLAATILLDRSDPTRLTWKEIESNWGTCFNFFLSYGLKPWDGEDGMTALDISRQVKMYKLDEDFDADFAAFELIEADREEARKKQPKDKKIKHKSAFIPSELDVQFADQVYSYIKSRRIASINYNEVVENIPYKGAARGIDVIRNDERFIESFTKISLRVTATTETASRTQPSAAINPAPIPQPIPPKSAAAGDSNVIANSDKAFADKVFSFLKSKNINRINYNQIIAKIPYNGTRRGIDVIREDSRFTESTSTVSLSNESVKPTKDFTREWVNVISKALHYDVTQLLLFVRTLELCDRKGPPSRKPKFILNNHEAFDDRDDVSVSSISSMSSLSVASSNDSSLSLRTQDSSDVSAASNPFFHLVNESDSEEEEEVNNVETTGNIAAADIAPTQCRYLLVRLKCAITEIYRNLAVTAQKEQKLSVCSENWVNAYDTLSGCFGDVELWAFFLTNTFDNLPEQHDKCELERLCHSYGVLAEDTNREKKKAIDLLDKKRHAIMVKLDPMLSKRDEIKKSWGQKWTQNPHPKLDYAEKRKLWEQQLRDIDGAITIIAPLRIISNRDANQTESRF